DPTKAHWVVCYRPSSADPFTAHNCATANALLPHLVEALNINRALAIGEHVLALPSRSLRGHALVDRQGGFLHRGAAFAGLMRIEGPDWSEPRRPESLLARLERKGSAQIAGGRVDVQARPFGGALLLTARRTSVLEKLSPRELELARDYSNGKSYRAIAADT